MIELTFELNSQVLKRTDSNVIASNSAEFHKVKFTFSEHWDNTQKTVIFRRGGKQYAVLLDNEDSCNIPYEVMQGSRDTTFEISVFGVGINSVLTSSILTINVIRGSETSGEISPEFTPDMFDQLMAKIEEVEMGQVDPEVIERCVENYLATKNILIYR